MRIFLTFGFLTSFFISTYAQNCDNPTVFSLDQVSPNHAEVVWFGANADYFEIDIQLQGIAPDSIAAFTMITDNVFSIFSLNPQTNYTAYLRAVCDSIPEDWISLNFQTGIDGLSNCGINLEMEDNNCSSNGQRIPLHVEIDSQTTPSPVFQGINIIIEHNYPADVQLSLETPTGELFPLITHQGTITDHFGAASPNCDQPMQFRIDACASILEANPPFIGSFRAWSDLSPINELDDLNGTWYLHYCDRASDDIGTLQQAELIIRNQSCAKSAQPQRIQMSDHSAQFELSPPLGLRASYLVLEDTLENIIDSFPMDPNIAITIDELDLNSHYQYYITSFCENSPFCRSSFQTLPGVISDYENWDDLALCESNCQEACTLETALFEATSSSSWDVVDRNTGSYPDAFTGTNYLQAKRDLSCQTNYELHSFCLSKAEDSLASYISIYTSSVSPNDQVLLLISENNGSSFDTLANIQPNQLWERQDIMLPETTEGSFLIAIQAHPERNSIIRIGDIALQNIEPTSFEFIFLDQDGDGFGKDSIIELYCGRNIPLGYSTDFNDCNDQDSSINPIASEVPCNTIDENCDGVIENESHLIQITDTQVIHNSCFGDREGMISIEASANFDLFYQWSTGDQDTNSISGLNAGNYHCIISDSTQCAIRVLEFEIEEPEEIQFSILINSLPTCKSTEDGILEARISGGVAPYQLEWSNGDNDLIADSLLPGDYFLTATDQNNCIKQSEQISIQAQSTFDVSIFNPVSLNCSGDSTARLRAVVPFTDTNLQYLWNTGDTTANLSNLSAGTYFVEVTDTQSCIARDTFEIVEPDTIAINQILVEQYLCPNDFVRSISADVIGGTPPYTYLWNNGDFTTSILNNVPFGRYELQIIDNNGCRSKTAQTNVQRPDWLVVSIDSISPTRCPNSQDGKALINVANGMPTSVIWSDQNTGLARNDLFAATYHVTISDFNNCKYNLNNILIPEGQDSIEVDLFVTDSIFCGQNVVGGIQAQWPNTFEAPYAYIWQNGQRGNSDSAYLNRPAIANVTFQITVFDQQGCRGTSAPLEIEEYTYISIDSTNIIYPYCNDMSGRIDIFLSNADTYSYLWSDGSSGSSLDIGTGGNYSVQITDSLNCEPAILHFNIPEISPISVDWDTSSINESQACFQIQNFEGGFSPYRFQWVHGNDTFAENEACIDLAEEISLYLVVQDSLNCEQTFLIYEKPVSSSTPLTEKIQVYPNPTTDFALISGAKVKQVEVYTSQGMLLKTIENKNQISLTKYPAGLYFLKVFFDNDQLSVLPIIKID